MGVADVSCVQQSTQETKIPDPFYHCTAGFLHLQIKPCKVGFFKITWYIGLTLVPLKHSINPSGCHESTVTTTWFIPPRISCYLILSVSNKQLSTVINFSVGWDVLLTSYPNILVWKEVKEKEPSGSRNIHLFPQRTLCMSKNFYLFFL